MDRRVRQWAIELERLVDGPGGRVVATAQQHAIRRGSGEAVALPFGLIFELERGRVARIRNFVDPEQALKAAGVSR